MCLKITFAHSTQLFYMTFVLVGVYSAYKAFLNKDEDIIKQLQKVCIIDPLYLLNETTINIEVFGISRTCNIYACF